MRSGAWDTNTLRTPRVKARNPLPKPRNAYTNNTQTNRTQTTLEKNATHNTLETGPPGPPRVGGVTKNPKKIEKCYKSFIKKSKFRGPPGPLLGGDHPGPSWAHQKRPESNVALTKTYGKTQNTNARHTQT